MIIIYNLLLVKQVVAALLLSVFILMTQRSKTMLLV